MPRYPQENAILSSFPPGALERLKPVERAGRRGEVLYEAGDSPDEVCFPHFGTVTSLIRPMRNGATVEVALAGFDGFTAITGVLGGAPEAMRVVVQMAGALSVVKLERLRTLMVSDPRAQTRILASIAALIEQVTQNAACNRLHRIEQRLAKWLLMMWERTGTDDLALTHEFVAHMLGIRRPGVSVALASLSSSGLIRHSRMRVSIRDHEGLEKKACECRGVLRRSLERSLGTGAAGAPEAAGIGREQALSSRR
jgi:CRP-like cAMP-binding protein